MAESTQHKLDRVRSPRVQITYDVEVGNAMQKKELPFVVGVMADLSGKPAEKLPKLKDRKFVSIDRDNFNEVLAGAKPRVAYSVPNTLTGEPDTKLSVELNFRSMDDFSPERVAEQVEPLRRLLEVRKRLTELLVKLDGNDALAEGLEELLSDKDRLAQLAGVGKEG